MDINELESYRLQDAVKFNKTLNPRLWKNEQLRPEVKQKLLAIANDFREFLGINELEVKDITISGSNAAYTYTPHSDIDLHLVVDLANVCNNEVYRELFDAKKYQYNDQHNYKIGGYDVELYVQDSEQPHHSQGIYSLLNDDWIRVPSRRSPTVDDISVKSKYQDVGARIEAAINSGNLEQIDAISKKVGDMRKAGLASTGEFGPENLAFKVLRNNGTLDTLRQAKLKAKDKLMSLDERKSPMQQKTIYGYRNYWFPGYDYYSQLTKNVDQPSEVSEDAQLKIKDKEVSLEKALEKFVKFCAQHLHLKTLPTIRLIDNDKFGEKQRTMGHYMDNNRTIEVSVSGRHVLDIMRTLAHELVHYSQHERGGGMPDEAGDTGSPWENEAHSVAGVLMRYFDRDHPEFFDSEIIDEGIKNRLAAAGLAAACIAGTPGCATTGDAIRNVQTVGTAAQTLKHMGRAGAEEEMVQRLKNELRRRQGHVVPEDVTDEDYDPNGKPPGPEFKPTMPAGTVKVDVSDTYDWYKLGQHISNLKGLGHHDFGKGPPSTIMAFGSEDEEHKYIDALKKTGLTTTDIDPLDPNQPKGMKRQKVDPTYNVNEAFDQPYKLKWEKGDYGDVDAIAKLSDGNYLSIMFNKGYSQGSKEEAWSVEFFRNNSQEVTGEGDAQRVFATVLGAIQTFIKKYKPNVVIFSATKEVEPGQNAQSRARLYDSLVQRYARAWGFNARRTENNNNVIYELSRIKQPVEEAVTDNYLYHATMPAGMMRMLRTGVIKATDRPQASTKAKTQYPTISTTRSKQYAESNDFVDFLNLTNDGNAVILVFDRNAVANHYKMFSTSQGTQTVGDEYEEVIVAPKGSMPIKGTLKGFYFNPKRTAEIQEYQDVPWFQELLKSPYYMGPKQNVAEATGYIPVNDKEARDPRYSMAITQDIKPGEVQRQARKMGFTTNAAGIPPTLKSSGKLDEALKQEINRLAKR